MTTEREPVDRAALRARMDTLTERTPSLQGRAVEDYLEKVVALAGPERHLNIDALPEEDVRELWRLTEAIADDAGLTWDDAPR
jgi:hypothetical protein